MKYLILATVIVAVLGQAPKKLSSSSTTAAPKGSSTTIKPAEFALNLTFVLSGVNLPTKDSNSKVDAFVKVFSIKTGAAEEERLGTTDTISDNDNPEWLNVFWVSWKRGSGQKVHFYIKDHDTLGKDDDVGDVIVDLDQYVEKNQDLRVPVTGGGELLMKRVMPTSFRLYARNIPAKDQFGGKSDPYVEIFWRRGREGTDTLIGTSESIDNEENPDWKETFEFANYQKGTNQFLFFKVWDKDSVTGSDFIGDLLVEADPFVTKRATKITKLNNSDGKATLAITPV